MTQLEATQSAPVPAQRSGRQEGDVFGTREEVARYLRRPVTTLTTWAQHGRGPVYRIVGKAALYRWSDVDAWLLEQPAGGGGPHGSAQK